VALTVSNQESDAVRRLPAPRRYEYLVKRVAVFPTDRGDEAAITPAEFAAAIQAELDRIE
jgi:hypothetical protein